MRRMIPQKQIEGLDNLNKAIEVTKIEGGDDYVTLKTDSVFMEGNYPFVSFDQNDDTEVWGYLGYDGESFSVGVTNDGSIYGRYGIDFSNGVNIWVSGEEVAKFYYDEGNKETYIILNLPTSDPQIKGVLWNDNGTLKISAGN